MRFTHLSKILISLLCLQSHSRNPFIIENKKQEIEYPVLLGITDSESGFSAALNWKNESRIFKVGEQCGPFEIKKIDPNKIEISGNGQILTLEL